MDLETLAKVVEQAIAQSTKTSSEPKLKSGANSSKKRSAPSAKTKASRTRKKLVVFRLSEEEFQQLQQEAEGMKLSNYLRFRLLKNEDSKRANSVIPLNNRLIYMRLHQLQTSINRYTRLVRSVATIPGCEGQDIVNEYLTLVETLSELIRDTQGELLGVNLPEPDMNVDNLNGER